MIALVNLLLAPGCVEPVVFTPEEVEAIGGLSPVPAPPADPTNAYADDPRAAALGQALFFSASLSADGAVSCASCHDPDLGLSDGRRLSEALGTTRRHAPHLFNVSHQRWFYWDGRKDSVWAQALSPLEDPGEHGTSRVELVHIVGGDAELAAGYEAVFGPLPDAGALPESARPADDPSDPDAAAWEAMSEAEQEAVNVFFANLGKALAAYQRLLVSAEAPFDALAADLAAGRETDPEVFPEEARRGLRLFLGAAGCISCHNGPLLSDYTFHNIGLGPRDWLDPEDLGRWDGVELVLADPFNGQGGLQRRPRGRPDQAGQPAAQRRVLRRLQDPQPAQRGPDRALHARGPLRDAGGDRRPLQRDPRAAAQRAPGGDPAAARAGRRGRGR